MDARFAGALMLGLCLGLAADAQSLFKCVKGGKVVYQDSKCEEDAKQSEVRPPDPPAPRAVPPADAKDGKPEDVKGAPELSVEEVAGIISNYQGCAADAPAFATKYAGAYEKWRVRNLKWVLRYEQDGAARKKVRDSMEFQRQRFANETAEGKADRAEQCDKVFGPMIEGKR